MRKAWDVFSVLVALGCVQGICIAQSEVVRGIIEDGRMLVPLRGVFEQLGASVEWYAPTRTVKVVRESTEVIVQVDYPKGWVDGREIDIDVPARLIEGRVYVPLRFVAEALGAEVVYADGVVELRVEEGAHIRVLDGLPHPPAPVS